MEKETVAAYKPKYNITSHITPEARKMLIAFADLCLNSEQFAPKKLERVNDELEFRYDCLKIFAEVYPRVDFYFSVALQYIPGKNMFILSANSLDLDCSADQDGLEFLEREFRDSVKNIEIPGNEVTPKIIEFPCELTIARICWSDFQEEPQNIVSEFDVHPGIGILMRYVLSII